MDYSTARDLYKRFEKILTPVSERLEVVGSIKRADPKALTDGVHDLEFLIIPRQGEPRRDLFGEPMPAANQGPSPLELILSDLQEDGVLRPARRKANGAKYKKFAIVEHSGPEEDVEFCLELFIVTPRTWAIQNVIRTGPSAFSHRFVTPDNITTVHKPSGKIYRGLLPAYYQYIQGETEIRVRSSGRVMELAEEKDAIRLLGLRAESDYWIPPEERYMYT